jgi:uncharacterized protein YfiM (DUF2279 family)
MLFMLYVFPLHSNAQDTIGFFDTPETYMPSRGKTVAIGLTSAYTLSMVGLYQLWYKDFPRSDFHFFNDNDEWLQVDKAGHLFSAYYLGTMGIGMMQWTGMSHKKAVWYGGASGWLFLTTVEIFDGFSSQWGFSVGDMVANTTGSLMAISQELAWKEQRIRVKFSFHQTDYPQYRPDLLGTSFSEQLFKDYNGQTYWLSGNISSFMHSENSFPKWLNLSFGYGAEGMTGANAESDLEQFDRYRQYFISPDIDLRRIKTRSKALKFTLSLLNFIKIPAPALEFTSKGTTKFHWLYF